MASARRGDLVTVDVTDLAFGGEGVARAGGYVVFVPGGVPGDRADVRLTQVRPRFARGTIERLERPSELRTEPPCPYFGRCGGCRLQHVRYEAQLEFKQRQVVECLTRLGGIGDVPVSPIIGAPEIYGYRNKMEFTFAEADGQPIVGLHEAERYDAILDVERCLLQSDGMNAVLAEVRAFVLERGWSIYRQDTEEGLLRFLMLREGRVTGEGMVNLVTASPDVATARALADRLRARCPHITSVVLNVNPKKAAVAVGVEEHPIAGDETIRERLGDLVFSISANSFFQTNTRQAERLFGIVAEFAGLTGQEIVLDLYAGTGACFSRGTRGRSTASSWCRPRSRTLSATPGRTGSRTAPFSPARCAMSCRTSWRAACGRTWSSPIRPGPGSIRRRSGASPCKAPGGSSTCRATPPPSPGTWRRSAGRAIG
jgi:23S rRNA (uracil1939-C5)-methyltransferase